MLILIYIFLREFVANLSQAESLPFLFLVLRNDRLYLEGNISNFHLFVGVFFTWITEVLLHDLNEPCWHSYVETHTLQ